MVNVPPAIEFPAELLLRAQHIKVLFLDVDGVFTDGGIYYTEHPSPTGTEVGETIKRFHTLDGFGLRLLQRAGITPVVISGRNSVALRARLSELDVTRGYFAVNDKLSVGRRVLQEMGITWADAAAMGDDWPDLRLMQACSFCAAPPNAHIEVRAVAHHVTLAPGGAGALREMVDLLLVASGRYVHMLSEVNA